MVFNLDDPLLANPLMRAALVLITDRGQLVADSIGFQNPTTAIANSRIFADGQPGSGSETPSPFGYNPSEGATVFKSLGYLPDVNGVLRDNGVGVPLTLTITGPKGNAVIARLEQQLQAQWAACGVTLEIDNVSLKRLLNSVLPEGRYELAIAPYDLPVYPSWDAIDYTDSVVPTPIPPGLALHGGFSVPSAQTVAATGTAWLWSVATEEGTEPGAAELGAVTRNVSGLNAPTVAKQFEQVIAELNTDAENQLISRLDGLLTRRLPTVPLFQVPVSLVQQADIVNVSESPSEAGPLWDAEDWIIEITHTVG